MKRQWYYRGSLKSCNYSCSYCPFSKKKSSESELENDRISLFRFVKQLNNSSAEGAVQIVPYGEALIHTYYWEALANLSCNPQIDAVGAQSNLSFPIDKMLNIYMKSGGNIEKLRLWCTFHPQMTSLEKFLLQCESLLSHNISFCVGTVGVPEQIELIRTLRQKLPESVYLWINKMDGLKRNYTTEEIETFLEIDPYFNMELAHYKSDSSLCQNNRFVESDGTMHPCNICKDNLGNIYSDDENCMNFICKRKECSCFLSYCNRNEEQLIFFKPYPAFRIPSYPKAVFFDIDGTLIPDGAKKIPDQYIQWLSQLSKHCKIYLATSLPYDLARRRTKSIQEYISGVVAANGGRIVINDTTQKLDKIFPFEADWLDNAMTLQHIYGFKLFTYKKSNRIYKVTFCFKKGFVPKDINEFLKKLGIPLTYHILMEEDCLQITDENTGKLAGILRICDLKGYNKNDAAFFGNSENDIESMKYFPFSVAVKNSCSAAQNAATYTL